MTYLDTLILFNLSLLSFIISSNVTVKEFNLSILQILLLIPITIFIMATLWRKVVCQLCIKIRHIKCREGALPFNEPTQNFTADNSSAAQPLIQPTSTVLSYGTSDN